MNTPLERAEKALADARQAIHESLVSLPARAADAAREELHQFEQAVRRHDAEMGRELSRQGYSAREIDNKIDPETASTDTTIVIRYDNGLTVRLTHWELDVYVDHLELEGRIAPGAPVPRVGAAVKLARLEIPGRGDLADIHATIALDSDEHPRLKLTAWLEADR